MGLVEVIDQPSLEVIVFVGQSVLVKVEAVELVGSL